MTDVERARGELCAAAFKNRALMHWHVFDELRTALGESQASTLAPADLVGLRDASVGSVPDAERMFAPHVERCDAAALDITVQRCPLNEAWPEPAVR